MTKIEAELIAGPTHFTDYSVRPPSCARRALCRLRILSASLTVLFSVGALSQTQLATLSGTITDPSGAVVPGVSVTIVGQVTGLNRSVLTDTVGEYRFAGLPLG